MKEESLELRQKLYISPVDMKWWKEWNKETGRRGQHMWGVNKVHLQQFRYTDQ